MEGKAHEHNCYGWGGGGESMWTQRRGCPSGSASVYLIIVWLPSFCSGCPQKPTTSCLKGHSHSDTPSSLCKHSLESWVLFVLTSQAGALSLEPICGVYALGHRALCQAALGSPLAGAWTQGP